MSNALLTNDLLNAQVGVLGSMLIDADTVGDVLARVADDDFTDAQYRLIYQAIRHIYTEAQPVDGITVNAKLGGNYGQILTQLMDLTPTAANCDVYVDLLKRSAAQVRLQELGERLAGAADAETAQAVVDAINQIFCDRPGVRITSLLDCYNEFLDRKGDGKTPDYLTWGIPALDEHIYVEGGDMVVIGGSPSAGKTALALSMGYHIAAGKRVGYFYFENNDKKLFERLVSSTAMVSFGKIKRNDLSEDDFQNIIDMRGKLTTPALHFIDSSGFSVSDIRAIALSRHYDLVIVDYLQKIKGDRSRKNLSDFERVSAISSDLQDFGKQTGVTILALSQLSRPEKKDGKVTAPRLSSLRQSGQIEQDADIVMLLYVDDLSQPTARTLLIAKNKEGEANIAMRMYFDGDTQTFSRVKRQEEATPKERQKPSQVSFWDGFQVIPDTDSNMPF